MRLLRGKPTVRGVIRADIDTIIHQAYTYDTFLMLLRRNGYEVRRSPNRKYTTVKPPGAKRAIRLDSLGEGYTEADILLRLSRQRHGGMTPPTVTQPVKRYRVKGKLTIPRKKKITGFQMEAKRYGVLFYPIVNKVEKTGTVEIMAKARDAKQINRIFERMGYPAPVKEDAAAKKRERPRSVREQLQGARAILPAPPFGMAMWPSPVTIAA